MEKVPIRRLALWFVASRLALLLVAWLALRFVPPGEFPVHFEFDQWLFHWDAGWYFSIAQKGYSYVPQAQSNVAFFPLYPLLAHLLGLVVPNLLVAGYLVSNGFLFGSCLLLWKLTVRFYGAPERADRAVLFFLLCPMTVFYSSFYTESQFFFLALSVAWLAGERRWLAAGACGFLAALTRPPGALLAVLIVAEYVMVLRQRRRDRDQPWFAWKEAAQVAGAIVLNVMGIVAFACYIGARFGDPMILFTVHAFWHHQSVPLWHIFWAGAIYHAFYIVWFYGAMSVALALLARGVAYRLRPSHLVLAFAFFLLYCSNNLLEAMPRYLSVVFPFYIVAAEFSLRRPRMGLILLGASAALAVLSVVLFVDGYWLT